MRTRTYSEYTGTVTPLQIEKLCGFLGLDSKNMISIEFDVRTGFYKATSVAVIKESTNPTEVAP